MCGISCLVNFRDNSDLQLNIKNMMRSLNHRGPDYSNYYLYKNVGIAHNRLSIIDLTDKARQPFKSKDDRYYLSYNGEIYNFMELKKILVDCGYSFSSTSDTEVVLYSLIHWGDLAIEKFNGMFAFILFDKLLGEIIIGRDRYGIKPLYYCNDSGYFALASEQKAILQINNYYKDLDYTALYEYFTFQNILTNKTLEKKIKIFPPGNIARFKISSKTLETKQYWEYNFKNLKSIKYNDAVAELEHLFIKAVKSQLVSDVEVSSYLSSGVDTSAISAIASKNINKLKTFTCGFDMTSSSGIEIFFDETSKAKEISKNINSNHNELIINSKDMENCLNSLVFHLEEPRVGQSYPNYLIAKYVSNHTKVVLSGTGGDELFAGYPWRYEINPNFNSFDEFIDNHYLKWQRLVNNSTLHKIFLPINSEVKNVWTKDIFSNIFNKTFGYNNITNSCLYFELRTFLSGLLIVEDKLSMAHGLEVRVPFLDNNLVDFALNCPIEYKLNSEAKNKDFDENTAGNKKDLYFKKTNNGKLILREVLSKFVSKDIAMQNKQGFSGPDSSWFKHDSYEFINDKLMNKKAKIYDYMDHKIIFNLINEHISGKNNRRLLLWSLLYFETYLDVFKI